eukprot:6265616-Alexandrium_andersonii.AAC.1
MQTELRRRLGVPGGPPSRSSEAGTCRAKRSPPEARESACSRRSCKRQSPRRSGQGLGEHRRRPHVPCQTRRYPNGPTAIRGHATGAREPADGARR